MYKVGWCSPKIDMRYAGLFTLYDSMIMILCLVKLLSCFPTLFYCCCGDRIVLGIARIMFLVTYVYLRCLASLHSCGVLARYPFTCKQGVILRLFLSCELGLLEMVVVA